MVLLDANIFFGLVTETVRLLQFGKEIPDLLLVGVGYPDETQHLGLRSRDLTPNPDDKYTHEWLNKVSNEIAAPVHCVNFLDRVLYLKAILYRLLLFPLQ